ncbi:MAG: penicillin-binding protein 1A [Bdellovibrionaceae bacterium]|nr:penicillin-binding protein 1A [Pseudobdellovibrionaceae bacterium]|tara:strand:- start:63923 stop:66754 length:2832 start_codon:yes stop_codon:yes gene_type:complete
MTFKKFLNIFIGLCLLAGLGMGGYVYYLASNLPKIITVEDYKPLVVSKVYAKDGQEIGEFFREKRIVVPYEKIPKHVVHAFLAAEDSSFFEHGGINLQAIFRAVIANIKAGRKVQGGSTITQQVAKSLMLTPEKTYTRKIKEAFLALQMEENLTKEEILYLYLNQIYLGQGAYGVQAAAESYFRKDVSELSIAEAAILAGLPQAPSRYSPTKNSERAKARQRYVLSRMEANNFITKEQHDEFVDKELKVYFRVNYKEVAPYYVETLRQYLVEELGEQAVLDEGIQVFTGVNVKDQLAANEAMQDGLREVDKRQGFRGAIKNIQDPAEIRKFLEQTKKDAVDDLRNYIVIKADGTTEEEEFKLTYSLESEVKKEDEEEKTERSALPYYYKLGGLSKAVVTQVNDKWGFVEVKLAETQGLIDFESMKWARKPNPELRSWEDFISKPSDALQVGDVIEVKILNDRFRSSEITKKLNEYKSRMKDKYERPAELPVFDEYLELALEQEPIVEGGLIAFDINTQDIVAMAGGYDFKNSQFNRTIQAARQTGSSFKSIVFGAALDKGYTPSTVIVDSPIVYEEKVVTETEDGETNEEVRKWKPHNYSEKFSGDILFRKALIKSMNIPTVKILDDIGVNWVAEYSRRLGIFSPLNLDLSLGLGSSSVTLYEMTKVFATFGRNGKRIRPRLLYKVTTPQGEVLLEEKSLDERFKDEIAQLDLEFEEKAKQIAEQKLLDEQKRLEAEANGELTEGQEAAEKQNTEPMNFEQTKKDILAEMRRKKFPDFYYANKDQLIDPKVAYLTTSLLSAVVEEGTGRNAKVLGRPTAAKTGTTNGFYDGWFIGYTANIATGVWVGFDNERSLGKSESGAMTALPIWLQFMKAAHEDIAPRAFPVPDGIVFANIDTETGQLATARSGNVVRQAFIEGTEPKQSSSIIDSEEEKELLKEDLVN